MRQQGTTPARRNACRFARHGSVADVDDQPATRAGVEEAQVVVAQDEQATPGVGEVSLGITTDQTRTDSEVEAMALAPIPSPQVLCHQPPVLALAALPGSAFGRRGRCTTRPYRHGEVGASVAG